MKYVLMTIAALTIATAGYLAGVMIGADHNYALGYAAGRAMVEPCPPVVAPPIGKAPWQ